MPSFSNWLEGERWFAKAGQSPPSRRTWLAGDGFHLPELRETAKRPAERLGHNIVELDGMIWEQFKRRVSKWAFQTRWLEDNPPALLTRK